MTALFHILQRGVWTAALAAGEYRAASLDTEGFIHCSFADQVAGVANRLYRDVADLCVVEFEQGRIPARVVVEDSYGSGTAFPHVYGPIPVNAAIAVHELMRGADGTYLFTAGGFTAGGFTAGGFTAGGAGASASPDR